MSEIKSTFKTLASINIKDKIEKKGRFDYLSWAYAWAMIKDKYPDVNRKVYESEHKGLNYFTDGKSGYVKVGITINGVEHIDYLPIMGNNNQSLAMDKIDSFIVNKTIQRSTVKAIAMHGLGLSLWAGEDLVDVSEDRPPVQQALKPILKNTHKNWADSVNYIKNNKSMSFAQLIKNIESKYTITALTKKELNSYYAN